LDDWITVKEACEISGYDDEYLRRLLRNEAIEAKKFGHVWMISKQSLLTYREAAEQEKDQRYRPKPTE